jgi:hypothetical protein
MKIRSQNLVTPLYARPDSQEERRREQPSEQAQEQEETEDPSLEEKVGALNLELEATSFRMEVSSPMSQGLRLQLKTLDGKVIERVPSAGFRGRLIDRKA